MIWRNPVAWLGLATLLIPVAIHLLVRHRAEPRPFPSLRFVQPTRLASVRRKMISDWPLLAIRLAMLAAAVAALADPLWPSAARRAEWNARQARAIVVDATPSVTGVGGTGAKAPGDTGAGDTGPSVTAALVDREVAGAFQAETIKATQLADGIRRAAEWLRTAPPARRELVVISDFQLGALDAAMLRDIPPHAGIRFVRTAAPPVTRAADGQLRTQRAANAANAAGGYTVRNPRVTVNANETAVTWADAASPSPIEIDTIDAPIPSEWAIRRSNRSNVPDITLRPFELKLRGSAADRPFLLAAAEAVLSQGVPLAAGVVGIRNGVTLMFAAAPTANTAPGPHDAGILFMPWQLDAARAIATDASLTRAAGRAMTTPGKTAASTNDASSSVASRSPAPQSVAASSAPARSESSAPSAPLSSEATAKSRTASNGANDAPEPWTVLVRDARGAPAVLAAADGSNAGKRMLLWSRVAAADETTALLIRGTLRALAGTDAFAEAEVNAIPDATLAQWQRPSSEPPASEWRDVDTGNDRRWLWGAVLVLLVAEQVLRRRTHRADARPDRPERKVFEDAA